MFWRNAVILFENLGYYGQPVVKSLYDVAVSLKERYTENGKQIAEYVQKVIDTVEGKTEKMSELREAATNAAASVLL